MTSMTTVPPAWDNTRTRTRRGALAASLSALTVPALAACQLPGRPQDTNVPRPTGQPVTLRYLGRGSQSNQDLQRSILAQFKTAQPKINVEMEVAANFQTTLLAQLASGDPADLAYTNVANFRVVAKQGGLIDLDPYVARDLKRTDFYEFALASGTYNGKLYALAYDGGTFALAYNRDLFTKAQIQPPDDTWTWHTYANTAAKLTIDHNGRRADEGGFDPAHITQYGSSSFMPDYWYYIWANGGDILTPDKKRSALDQPGALETLQWIADLHTRRVVMPSPAFPDPDTASVAGDVGYTSGRVAMTLQGRWRVPEFRRLARFAWDVAPMPKGKVGRIGYGYYSGMSLLHPAKHPGEAWELAKHFGTEPGQRLATEGGLNVPSVQRLATGDVFQKSTPPSNNRAYLDAINNARLFQACYIVDIDKYNAILNPVLANLWKGAVTARTAIPPLVPQLNDVLLQGQG